MKGKLKGAREILAAKTCILLLIIAGITGVTYTLLNKLFVEAIAMAITALIGIALLSLILKTSKNIGVSIHSNAQGR